MKNPAFTLVELIVVITILSVLSTIAFISFQGYGQSSRDSVRLSDMRIIEKAFELQLTKWNKLPYPTDYITITSSGVILWYQWYASAESLWQLWIADTVLDPLDNKEYTYVINSARTEYQLLWFLESDEAESSSVNVDSGGNDRYPLLKWDELWILFDDSTSEPAQDIWDNIDVQETITSYDLYLNNYNDTVVWSSEVLTTYLDFRVNEDWSCLSILKNGLSTWDGIYTIDEWDADEHEVFCNMTKEGWGWTLVLKADWNNETFTYHSALWKNSDTVNPTILSEAKTEFKSEVFSTQLLNEVLLVLETGNVINQLVIPKTASSLYEVFNAEYSETNLGKQAWMDAVPWSSLQPYCNEEWFNANRVRIGISSNNEEDCGSNDSRVWIGLNDYNSYDTSVWNYCWSSLCSEWNKEIKSFGYIYIR